MPSTRSLLKQLQADYPQFHITTATEFWWSAATQTVHIDPKAANSDAFSLHELSHALLGHHGYTRDIDLVKLERDAWDHAITVLAPHYNITISDTTVQDNLDTYRDWLHARSTCPDCQATGLQHKQQQYRCIACGHSWRVNDARLCALRRYSLQSK